MHRSLLLLALSAVGLYAQSAPVVKRSKIAVYDLKSNTVKVIYQADKLIEAPNWSPDGKYLLVNTGGELYRLPVSADGNASLEKINLNGLTKCNNDKGFSPKGDLIAFSSSGKGKGSQVFTVPVAGGEPTLLVAETPSYFHAFSPDAKFVSFVAQRNGNFDLYRVPLQGGEQQRLTSSEGYDDGPDYSPDGKWIYFNSNRSGSWDIWRIPATGAGEKDDLAERITNDDMEDWFPHCSPDNKWLVFLSFPKGTSGHSNRLDGVSLRMLPLPKKGLPKKGGSHKESKKIQTLTTFFGGQGTINVNSWAPDSSKFAYVIFEP